MHGTFHDGTGAYAADRSGPPVLGDEAAAIGHWAALIALALLGLVVGAVAGLITALVTGLIDLC
jgi:hypothetical protein